MNSDPDDRDEEAELRARLAKLSGALKARTKASDAAHPPDRAPSGEGMGRAMSLGLRVASEFVSAVVVGAAIGWGFDRMLGTKPAFLIVFFFLGVAAGVWNVIRMTSPKGGSSARNSSLSRVGPPDKDVRRSASRADHAASQGGRDATSGIRRSPEGADEDED